MFRNSSLWDLLDYFENEVTGRKFVAVIESSLKIGNVNAIKAQLDTINLSISSSGRFSKSIQALSFTSTSIKPSNSFKEMANNTNVLNIIRVGKNVKGMYASFALGENKFSYQKEVIINANVKKTLVSVNYIKGQVVLEWFYGD